MENIEKEYGELVQLVKSLHCIFTDKKFRSACRVVVEGLEKAHGCFQEVAAYKGMNECDRVHDTMKRLGRKRTALDDDTLEKCNKMYDMRASVFCGTGWSLTRPMHKLAKQTATALKRVLVEEEIGVGNVLAYVSGNIADHKKFEKKVEREYKEIDKKVKEYNP